MVYDAVNTEVLAVIPETANRILDLGCGTGAFGKVLKSLKDREIVGITYSKEEADIASKFLDKVLVQDLNHADLSGLGDFDCVVCSHVLEHLNNPGEQLAKIKKVLRKDGSLIVALPNILHWRQRLHFLFGYFRYTQGGLMDDTHFRFFDFISAQDMIRKSGFSLTLAVGKGTFPASRFIIFGKMLDNLSCKLFPGLFGWQFVFVAKPSSAL